VVVAIAATMSGSSLASAEIPVLPERETEVVPASLLSSPWLTGLSWEKPTVGAKPTLGRTLTIDVSMPGWCVGNPRYRLDHVEVVERPKTTKRPFGSAVITAFIYRPSFERLVPGRVGRVIYGLCADVGSSPRKIRIKLKRPAERLIFYDGSSARPHRVYPPVGTPPAERSTSPR